MSYLALDQARARHQAAAERTFTSTITLFGTDYPAAVLVGRVEQVMKDDGSGWERIQDLTATVRKSRLPTAPAEKTHLIHGGVPYLIVNVGGQNAGEIAWVLKARRRMS